MILATDSCTIAVAVDVRQVDTFYRLQASTATAPTRPTEVSPSGWATTEPAYDGTSTNTLYTCAKTTLTDGTFYWSTVSKSTSYEAAKVAWNKADAAQSELNNLEIGGRNYVLGSAGTLASGLGSASGSRHEYQAVNLGQSYMGVAQGTKVTVSFDLHMTVNTANPQLMVYNTNNRGPKAFSGSATGTGTSGGVTKYFTAAVGDVISQRVSVTGYINDRASPSTTSNYLEFYSNYGTSNWFSVSNLKLELGNRATDWTPAPEDLVSATHRLWYRTDSELTTLNAPSTWVAEATGNVWNQWTTKVPPLAASTDDGLQKYPFLWTCEQRKRPDGTCECDKPQLDEHVTVIDGSMLVKGSVTAEEIAANTITTDNIVTGGLRIGNFSEEDQASILNSELREDIDNIRDDLDTYIEDTTAVVADLPTADDLSALDGRLVEAENAVESLKAGQLRSESWFDFDTGGGTGLHIGKVGSAFSTVVDEDSLDFVYTEDGDQTILATASGKGFDAPHLSASEDLTVAEKYRFTMLDADTFALIYVG